MSSADEEGIELDGLPFESATVDDGTAVERIATEFAERIRRGEQFSLEHFIQRHRQYAEELREILPLIAEIEDWQASVSEQAWSEQLVGRLTGHQFAGYRVENVIGRGGTATVFKAVSPQSRTLALKVFHPTEDARSEYELAKETRPIQRLNHPSILSLLDFGVHEGLSYHVMPLFEGVSLDRLIRRLKEAEEVDLATLADAEKTGGAVWRRDAWELAAKLGIQIAQALDVAHARGLLHNDVKPSNVMLAVDGRAVLTDFCTVREGIPPEQQMQGTLRYMAPERCSGLGDPRSDLFSLGVTLFELVTLAPAFQGTDRLELAERVRTAQLLPPRAWEPGVPEALSRIVRRATARNPHRRYASAGEMAGELHQFLSSESISSEFRYQLGKFWGRFFSRSQR